MSEDKRSDERKLKKCVCRNIRMTSRVATNYFDTIFLSVGIKAAQFSLLSEISSRELITIGELAEIVLMDQTTVTRNIELLRKLSYVDIKTGKDLRRKYISISKNGQAILEKSIPLWEQAQEYIVKEIGEEKFDELLETLLEIQNLLR